MHLTKSQFAWVMYDFANSAFHLMIVTVLFPLYFRQVLAAQSAAPDMLWSIVVAVPVVLMGLLSPVMGAVADALCRRKTFLVFSFAVAILFTGLLATTGNGSLVWGTTVFMIAMLGFHASLFLYNAFLPLQTGGGRGTAWLSGLGWGLGYLGGLLCLALLYPLLSNSTLPEAAGIFRVSFLIVAAYYLVFSLPTALLLREDQAGAGRSLGGIFGAIRAGIRQVAGTLRNRASYKEVFKFLGGFYLVNDGLATLVYFTAVFATVTLGLSVTDILVAFVIVQVVGIPATILAGYLAERIGYKTILLHSILIWIAIVMGFFFAQTREHVFLLSAATGLVIGSTPAIARALLSRMVAQRQAAEVFGFHALTGRVSSVVGPLLFGLISTATGSQRPAIISLLVFFVLGYLVLRLVRVDESIGGEQ